MAEYINSEFLTALNDLEKEKGIGVDILLETIEIALKSAYKKHFGSDKDVRVEIDRNTGEIHVYYRKTVVKEVQDERNEISLEEARTLDPEFEIDDVFESEVTPRSFGRIAAQTAKQVVVQRLREAERNLIYDAYTDKEGEIVTGIVLRQENKNVFVDLGRTEAVLPPNEQIPGESYRNGDRIKLYVTEVRRTSKGAQVFVSRTHNGLLRRLLEAEVPEIYDGTVELKTSVREPGVRAKIAVYSKNQSVDPIGACVGAKGMRIQNISNELNGEKLEVVRWSEDPIDFIVSAMSPAKVLSVTIYENERFAQVVVPDYQLSLAIGKEGQNARLAVRLTGWKIDIKSESQMAALREEQSADTSLDKQTEDEILEEDMAATDSADDADIENKPQKQSKGYAKRNAWQKDAATDGADDSDIKIN